MLLTLFCDASYRLETNVAGWGAWAKRNEWERGLVFGGLVHHNIRNSTDAETCGIACAISNLSRNGSLAGISSILVQCDSASALGVYMLYSKVSVSHSGHQKDVAFIHKRKNISPAEQQALEEVERMLDGRRVFLRHVKGHSNNGTRSWVNRVCDHEARKHINARNHPLPEPPIIIRR